MNRLFFYLNRNAMVGKYYLNVTKFMPVTLLSFLSQMFCYCLGFR